MKQVFITLCLSLFCCFALTASVVVSNGSSDGIYIQLMDGGDGPPDLPPPTLPSPTPYELITQSSTSGISATLQQQVLSTSSNVVDIELYNGKGVLVSKQQTTLNNQGFVYVTTQGLPQGCYTVKATIMGKVVGIYNISLQ